MYLPTDIQLRQLADNVTNIEDTKFHSSTCAYIKHIVSSYHETLIRMGDNETIANWLKETFPESVQYYNIGDYDSPVLDAVMAVITDIMKRTLAIFDGYPNDYPENFDVCIMDSSVLPWDVQYIIANTPHLSRNFNIYNGQDSLPVTISLGGNIFRHSVTLEFMAGLLLFSHPNVGNLDVQVIVYNIPLTNNYIIPTEEVRNVETLDDEFIENHESRFKAHTNSKYRVTVIDSQYQFDTVHFMHGFSTGAQWADVNHHDYWTNLLELHLDTDGNINYIPLIF